MGVQDKKRTLNCGGKQLVLDKPIVFGILNITPDSFFDGGKHTSIDSALAQTEKMLEQGASVIDVGAYSSRPGVKHIPEEEELSRLIPTIESIAKVFPEAIASVDTFRSKVATEAVHAGAGIINDISGGSLDAHLFTTIAKLQVPYVLMHLQGNPQNMQQNPVYDNVGSEVKSYLKEKVKQLNDIGVKDIIIDPGFGFGKTTEHNYLLLKCLKELKEIGCPILVGISRKSMINKVIGTTPATALNGTSVANTIALLNGADILRVHDVKQAIEAIKIVDYLKNV